MRGSYGGTIFGFLQNLESLMDNYNFLNSSELKIYRFYFIKYFWNFLLNNSSCFTFLSIIRLIAKAYSEEELPIKFYSFADANITILYKKAYSIRVYRKIIPPTLFNDKKAIMHRLFTPTLKRTFNSSKWSCSCSKFYPRFRCCYYYSFIFLFKKDFCSYF